MDGRERGIGWKNLKQRLGFKGMGCCGASWSLSASNMSIREEAHVQEQHGEQEMIMGVGQTPAGNSISQAYVGQIPVSADTGMNLATALAAERNLRAVRGWEGGAMGPTTAGPVKSLRRLIEEADGVDGVDWKNIKDEEGGFDGVCCVCMERNKGAAFIPCGHTFCRVCSREVWVNRGLCPICNRSIIEILDIF